MTKRVLKNLELLKTIHQCNTNEKHHFLKTAKPELVNAICDCVHNVLQGKVPLSKHHKQKLKAKKVLLRKLASRKTKTPTRKRLLNQHGGGILNSILGPVLQTLAGLVL